MRSFERRVTPTIGPASVERPDATMQAIVQDRYGSADVLHLAEVRVPEIGDGDVLVRVRAASIGAWVDHFVAGEPLVMRLQFGLRRPRQRTHASDLAGVVVAVGGRVEQFRVGDRVYGEAAAVFAEYAATPATSLSHVPARLSDAQAAAIPIAGQIALLGLRDHGGLRPGQHVMIIGAAGGVGSFAVQIAKARDAEVTAVCSSRSVDLVRSLGADHVIDYTERDLTAGSERYDVVFQLAGAQPASQLRRILTPGGTLVLSSGEGGHWIGPLGRLGAAMITSPFADHRVRTYVTATKAANLVQLTTLVDRGRIEPVVDRTYPLAEMADALRHFRQPHGQGKTVVTIDGPGVDETDLR